MTQTPYPVLIKILFKFSIHKIYDIKNYCLSSNISNNQLFDSLVWIALRLVAINYCIRFNNSLEENNED